jgi:hypothetical protein
VLSTERACSYESNGIVPGHVEPMTGIEPAYSAWEADVLPLNYIGLFDQEG